MILEKNCKRAKKKNLGTWAPTSQHREATPRRRPTPQHGMPHNGEAEVP